MADVEEAAWHFDSGDAQLPSPALFRPESFILFSPTGKPAGIPCVQLLDDYRCAIFGRPERPAVCRSLRPSPTMCGDDRGEAMAGLAALEAATRPH